MWALGWLKKNFGFEVWCSDMFFGWAKFFQIYRPINGSLPPILSAQWDLHGEIPENRFFVITFDWSVLRTSG